MAAKRNRVMCVKIAKDVLKQLRLKRYVAQAGTYICVSTPDGVLEPGFDDAGLDLSESFKEVFKTNKNITCDVCALGSAFVSLVNLENKCSVKQMGNRTKMFQRLKKYFGAENIVLMESAFECAVMDHVKSDVDHETLMLAIQWGRGYDDEKRLRAIMLNVVRNKGDFKIPKKMLARAAAVSAALDAGNDSW